MSDHRNIVVVVSFELKSPVGGPELLCVQYDLWAIKSTFNRERRLMYQVLGIRKVL